MLDLSIGAYVIWLT